jgi:hypothetical protein
MEENDTAPESSAVVCSIAHDKIEIDQEDELRKLTPHLQRVVQVLKDMRGNISNTCHFFKVSRRTFYYWKENNPIFAQLVDEIQEARIDRTESVLDDLIEAKEPCAVFFLLKTIGKKRGYIETQRVEHEGAVPVVDIEKEKRIARQLLEEQKQG